MKDSLLESRCVCARRGRANTQEETEHARSRSDVEVSESGHVVIGVRIVQCHHVIMDNCEHVVIGVRVMHCHHALMANVHFWSQFQLVTCSQFQLVVRLYELIVAFFCSHFVHTFTPRKHVILRCCIYTPRQLQ